ncbi:MAG: DUF393 domain-containing protein [Candidatus Krumholzibacteriota bacterium]|nr:DUF393 domain-containing protein [Candidatus Krumholzibacteriota bacterium]
MHERIVVWFDGECNLCNGFVDFLIRRDPDARIQYGMLQSPRGRELCRDHGIDDGQPGSVLVTRGDEVLFRSKAALVATRELGGIWKLAAVFFLVPRPLRDAVYDMIARSRYRIFGRRACRVPSPEERVRFIEGDDG